MQFVYILHCKLSNKLEIQVGKSQVNTYLFKKLFQNSTYSNSIFSPIRFLIFLNCILFSLKKFFIVVQVQFSAFSPQPCPPPQRSPPPSPITTPLGIVHVSFIIVPVNPSPKDESGHPCLVPDLSGKALSFCP